MNKRNKSPKVIRNKFSRLSQKSKLLVGLLVIFTFSGIGAAIVSFGFAAAIPNGTYSTYVWSQPDGGFKAMQHELVVESLQGTPSYYWAHQVYFIGGQAAYIGMQSNGNRVNGTQGKTAVFSIFGASIAGSSGKCKVDTNNFDGYSGLGGTSCRIPYEWVVGRKYQFTMRLEGTGTKGRFWSGYVKDQNTGVDTHIGNINIPSSWQGLSDQSTQWSEYFGARPATCAALPLSVVRFYIPRTYLPYSTPQSGPYNRKNDGPGECKNSYVGTDKGAVIQRMGGVLDPASKNP